MGIVVASAGDMETSFDDTGAMEFSRPAWPVAPARSQTALSGTNGINRNFEMALLKGAADGSNDVAVWCARTGGEAMERLSNPPTALTTSV